MFDWSINRSCIFNFLRLLFFLFFFLFVCFPSSINLEGTWLWCHLHNPKWGTIAVVLGVNDNSWAQWAFPGYVEPSGAQEAPEIIHSTFRPQGNNATCQELVALLEHEHVSVRSHFRSITQTVVKHRQWTRCCAWHQAWFRSCLCPA